MVQVVLATWARIVKQIQTNIKTIIDMIQVVLATRTRIFKKLLNKFYC